ncbi:MAG: TonB-dependent receptor, partial [Gemmatimonadaceae bacterium]
HLSGSLAGGVTSSDFVGDTPTAMEHRLTLSGGGDGFTYSLGGSYDHFGEVVFQSDWQQAGAHGRAVLTQGSLNLALTAAFSRRVIGAGNFPAFVALGAPSLSAPRNEDYYLGNQLVGATLTYTPSPRWQHVVTVGFNGIDLNVNNYAPRNIFPGDTLRNASLETDDQLTLRYVTSATATLGSSVTATTTGGIDLSRRTRNYYQGDGLDDPQVGSSAQSDYIEAYRVTDNAGFFAQQVLGFGDRLFFTAGIRAEDNSNVGSEEGLIWAPRAGVAYTFDLGNDLALKPRVSYGKSIRPPQPGLAGSSQDPFFIQRANPNLRPEVQLGVDAGFDLDYRQGTLTLEATYFDQDAKDLIGLVYLSDLSADPLVTQYQNVGRVNNKGVELAAGVNVGLLSLRGSYSTVKSRIESLAQGYSGEQVPGDEMLFVARHSGGGTAGLRFTPLFASQGGRSARFELGLTYIGGRRTLDLLGLFRCLNGLDPCRGGLRAYQTNLSPFTKWRLGLSHPVSRAVEAFLNVENLTDEQVGEFVTVAPSRGRTVLVGIRFGQ